MSTPICQGHVEFVIFPYNRCKKTVVTYFLFYFVYRKPFFEHWKKITLMMNISCLWFTHRISWWVKGPPRNGCSSLIPSPQHRGGFRVSFVALLICKTGICQCYSLGARQVEFIKWFIVAWLLLAVGFPREHSPLPCTTILRTLCVS